MSDMIFYCPCCGKKLIIKNLDSQPTVEVFSNIVTNASQESDKLMKLEFGVLCGKEEKR